MTRDTTLKAWIEIQADGESFEAVVIGPMFMGASMDENQKKWPAIPAPKWFVNYFEQPRGEILTWEQAIPWISYVFCINGGADYCNAITAWTKSWVIGVAQSDGTPSPFRVPRNPINYMPEMPGD